MRDHLSALSKLEFEKVKSHIDRYIQSDLGREHTRDLSPLSDPMAIRKNITLVSEMKLLIESDDPLPLEHVLDVRKSLHLVAIEDYLLSSEELRSVSLAIDTGSKIFAYFSRRKQLYPHLSEVVGAISVEKLIRYNIDLAIDEYGKVKDNATKEIARVRQEINDKKIALRKTLEQILKSVVGKEWVQEEIITTRDGRMVIPIKVEHKNRVPGFIHSTSASGATVYIEPTETLELNNSIRTLEFEERREIEKLLRQLSDQVRGCRDKLMSMVDILGSLDFIHAKAKFSIELIGAEPRFVAHGPLRIINGYHPILLQRHKRDEVIPLNIEIGGSVNTVIITGPNAGGKSVALKTVGLLCMMAQSGCHIPASPESELPVFTDIFVDIGDEQSIENDLSSFSSHLNNLKFITENANDSSLVLLDEIGSGTDPVEGAAIAGAVLENLLEIGCTTVATTHHGSLKAFAYDHDRIENAAMEFNLESLTPTYRYRAGIPGSSYALEMAQRLHLSTSLIERAKALKGEQATNLESLILDLERQSQSLSQELAEMSRDKQLLTSSIQDYKNKVTSLEKEIKTIKSQAVLEAQQIVEQANSTIENMVKQIKEQAATREVISTVRTQLKQMKAEFMAAEKRLVPEPLPREEIKVGSYVRFKDSTSEGEVVELKGEDTAFVVVGSLRIRTSVKSLTVVPRKDSDAPKGTWEPIPASVKTEIDLRGMYADEAISVVEKALDEAILNGLHRIDIIHGKGTGALRRKISEFLKTHPSVISFRLGEWNEGGSGVTVVVLK